MKRLPKTGDFPGLFASAVDRIAALISDGKRLEASHLASVYEIELSIDSAKLLKAARDKISIGSKNLPSPY